MLSSTSDKAKLFAENFSKKSNLDDSGISLPVFPSRTKKEVIKNLDLSRASDPHSIPVVVLKTCEPELSYILAELFNKCLKESCFPDCWKVSSVVLVFNNVGERSTARNYRPVSLLSIVSKVFEKLVNNRIVDHLEKCGLFSDFRYGFRSSRSTADLLTVVSDRIARAFNRSGATPAVALDIYIRLLAGFGMLVFFTNLSLMEFQVRYLNLFLLFSVTDDFEWFWMGSLHKNIQLMLEFLRAPFLVLHILRSSRSTADLLTVVSDRIARAFNRSGATPAVALDIYIRLLAGFGMLVFFTNLSLMEFQVRYLNLFLLFSVTDDFEWFWMGSLHKNIQLMLEFLRAPFLVLHFSYYTLMTFLMMLSAILLPMLMILLSILSVIRHLLCGNDLNLLLNLNLIYETLWTEAGSGLLISILSFNTILILSRATWTLFRETVISSIE